MGKTVRRGPRKAKYSITCGKVIDMVKTRADLPVNPHHGQLCLVKDEARSFVYYENAWFILAEQGSPDNIMISKAEALKMDKEADEKNMRERARQTFFEELDVATTDEAKIRELEAVFPDATPPEPPPEAPSPQGHPAYWIERQYVCTYCGRPSKHRVGWIFQGNNPQGDTVFFCSVDCCHKWEATLDNMNNRRGAIEATKRARAEREKNG
jgi:hypothetical protein